MLCYTCEVRAAHPLAAYNTVRDQLMWQQISWLLTPSLQMQAPSLNCLPISSLFSGQRGKNQEFSLRLSTIIRWVNRQLSPIKVAMWPTHCQVTLHLDRRNCTYHTTRRSLGLTSTLHFLCNRIPCLDQVQSETDTWRRKSETSWHPPLPIKK